jgi:hypothetical protein
MLVEQYSAEFQRLSRYALNLIPDEESKAERFRDCIVPPILERIIFVKVTDYTEMVHVATMAKKGIKTTPANYISKKRSISVGTFSTPPSKRQATSSSTGL